jgi:hypothetical protein
LFWIDPKNGMVRQNLSSGGIAYAFLQEVNCLFQKKDHLFVRGRSGQGKRPRLLDFNS